MRSSGKALYFRSTLTTEKTLSKGSAEVIPVGRWLLGFYGESATPNDLVLEVLVDGTWRGINDLALTINLKVSGAMTTIKCPLMSDGSKLRFRNSGGVNDIVNFCYLYIKE